MSKYDPLGTYLEAQASSAVPMKFSDIERIIGFALPAVAKNARAWWSNNTSNNVMTKVWMNAGFKSEQVDMAAECLVFRRVGETPPPSSPPSPSRSASADSREVGRLFGCLKGTVLVSANIDLSAPVEVDWGGTGA